MKTLKLSLLSLLTLCCVGISHNVEARAGTYDIGYGTKAKGMGGLAVALPQDSLVGAINPAGYSWICDRADLGLEFIVPVRKYTSGGTIIGYVPNPNPPPPFVHGFSPPGSTYRGYPLVKYIPHSGMCQYVGCGSTIGYSIYGAGGGTWYKRNNPIASGQVSGNNTTKISNKIGLELRTILSAFSYSYAFDWCNSSHSVGASLIWALQSLHLKGLYAFDNAGASVYPGHVTNNGLSWSTGVGGRFGYIGKFFDRVTIGASYTTRIEMSKTRKYEGIVTNRGDLDVPPLVAVGITYDIRPCTRIGFEWQRVFYSDSQFFHNSFGKYIGVTGGTKKAGAPDGPGLGWKDMDVYKTGIDHALNDCWVVRAGYVHSPIPYSRHELDVNILTQDLGGNHLTLGATYKLSECAEIDVSYFHMFQSKYSGRSRLAAEPRWDLSQRMYQDSIEFNYGYRF